MVEGRRSAADPPPGATPAAADPVVRVRASARLHLGFFDLHGGLGRHFGSIGLTLDAPATVVEVRRAPARRVTGPGAARAAAALDRLTALDLSDAVDLRVTAAIPEHVGLGSGTQLDLAVGAAVARLAGAAVPTARLAAAMARGARSGIGLGAFATGGLLVDGGRGAADRPPPITARLPVPEAWRILLIHDRKRTGLHAEAERQAFARLPPFPEDLADRLCRLVLMQALPAAAEGDAEGFGAAIGELQRRVGDHFAPAQGGRFTSPAVAEALARLEAQGANGTGQSSWGPTGFAILGDPDRADALLRQARRRWAEPDGLAFQLSRGRNEGAAVEGLPAERLALAAP